MQPLRVVLTGLGGVFALASLVVFVHYRSSTGLRQSAQRHAVRPAARFASRPYRHRMTAYYRVSLN